jgi:NitT/TauT family transport system permease protein
VSTRKKEKIPGSLKRLTIWLLLIATWEAAYRVIQWAPITFPAPSHVLDGTLALLQIQTRFGEPVSTPGWPRQELSEPERAGLAAYRAGQPASANPYAQKPGEPELSYNEARKEAQWERGYQDGTKNIFNSPLVEALLVSSVRLGAGFALSIVLGAVIGVLAWRFQPIDDFLGPVLLGIQTLPSICWVPLAMIFFGITEQGILFVLAMGSFSAVAIALRDGLRAIPPLYQQAGRMMGARGWRLYLHVLLPASLPALATSLRQGFSFAWRSLMGAELILTAINFKGLGYRLTIARDAPAVEQVIALLLIMILIGMLTDRWIFAKLQKRISQRFGLLPREDKPETKLEKLLKWPIRKVRDRMRGIPSSPVQSGAAA